MSDEQNQEQNQEQVQEPKWKALVQKARDIRDNSQAEVEKFFPANRSKHLDPLPEPLPLNVTGLPKLYLSTHDYDIIETDPIVLLNAIAARKYTALEVASAYIHAAVLAQRAINNVTEFLPQLAYEQAVFLDKYIEEHGKPIGPLHGLPISLKDKIDLAGRANNFALAALVNNIREKDAVVADILRENGAVFYQRTTQPQFLMHIETDSIVYGYTLNPFNTSLTCGGSSGGEGAAGGFHSSSIGIGTDIGGSVRAPAGMQGLYGLKPTAARIPISDTFAAARGFESILSSAGPLGRTLEITKLVTKVIIESKPWIRRRELAAIPWNANPLGGGGGGQNNENKKTKIRIGVLSHDGIITPQPPVKRALREVTEKLQSIGSIDGIEIEVVPFEPYQHSKHIALAGQLLFSDGGKSTLEYLTRVDEPLLPLSAIIFGAQNPNPAKELTVTELWALNVEKEKYRVAYNDYWQETGIDVLISPLLPGPPQPHDTSYNVSYTLIWNLLDYPGISFPVTTVDQEKDTSEGVDGYGKDFKPLDFLDGLYYERYKPEVYRDAPVALQLVAQRNEDEALFEYLEIIEKVLKA